jgi:hypothetical protein
MVDWEMFDLLVDEEYLTDQQRFERREMRRELMWSISPLTFAAMLLAIAAQVGWRAMLSGARRSWARLRQAPPRDATRSRGDQLSHEQAQIETAGMNQQALSNVGVAAEARIPPVS